MIARNTNGPDNAGPKLEVVRGRPMGEVIRFPEDAGSSRGRYVDATTEPATVIILPVVRIERSPDGSGDQEPQTGTGRRRRRRAAR
jgi:hypothetical protein